MRRIYGERSPKDFMEAVDLTKLLKREYEGQWILYSPASGEVYACEAELKDIVTKAKTLEIEDLQIQKVLPHDESFAPQSN